MLLVLDVEDERAASSDALPAFRDLVASYQFVAGNVRTPTRPGIVKKP